ncbi:hypothetical protein VTG60DRAFT_1487 [Thermothelomyces hinnuleus]
MFRVFCASGEAPCSPMVGQHMEVLEQLAHRVCGQRSTVPYSKVGWGHVDPPQDCRGHGLGTKDGLLRSLLVMNSSIMTDGCGAVMLTWMWRNRPRKSASGFLWLCIPAGTRDRSCFRKSSGRFGASPSRQNGSTAKTLVSKVRLIDNTKQNASGPYSVLRIESAIRWLDQNARHGLTKTLLTQLMALRWPGRLPQPF